MLKFFFDIGKLFYPNVRHIFIAVFVGMNTVHAHNGKKIRMLKHCKAHIDDLNIFFAADKRDCAGLRLKTLTGNRTIYPLVL